MSKKNFVALAGILNAFYFTIPKNDVPGLHNFATMITNLCDYLKTTNPKFDQLRFIAAVYEL